jgi:hypothetical protein
MRLRVARRVAGEGKCGRGYTVTIDGVKAIS